MKFREFLNEQNLSEDHFKKGQSVCVCNAKSYDALAKSDEVDGEIIGSAGKHKGEEHYSVKVGTGSYTVKASDIKLK